MTSKGSLTKEEKDLHRLLIKAHNVCVYILNTRYGLDSFEAERWKPKIELYAKAVREGKTPYRELLRIRREITAAKEKLIRQIIAHIEK